MTKKTIDLAGMTANQAIATIEDTIGERLPREVIEIVEMAAKVGGGKIADLRMEDTGKRVKAGNMPTAGNVAFDLGGVLGAEITEDNWHEHALAEFGPVPEYNGVVGDSCDCDACNYRRKFDSIDLTKDMKDGLTPTEAKAKVAEGYAKTGRAVPEAATFKAGAARVGASLDKLGVGADPKDVLNEIMGKTAQKLIDAHFPGARQHIVDLFGEGHPNVAKLDELYKELREPHPTKEAQERMYPVLKSLVQSVAEARRQAH